MSDIVHLPSCFPNQKCICFDLLLRKKPSIRGPLYISNTIQWLQKTIHEFKCHQTKQQMLQEEILSEVNIESVAAAYHHMEIGIDYTSNLTTKMKWDKKSISLTTGMTVELQHYIQLFKNYVHSCYRLLVELHSKEEKISFDQFLQILNFHYDYLNSMFAIFSPIPC